MSILKFLLKYLSKPLDMIYVRYTLSNKVRKLVSKEYHSQIDRFEYYRASNQDSKSDIYEVNYLIFFTEQVMLSKAVVYITTLVEPELSVPDLTVIEPFTRMIAIDDILVQYPDLQHLVIIMNENPDSKEVVCKIISFEYDA